jgi:hypothetical protein
MSQINVNTIVPFSTAQVIVSGVGIDAPNASTIKIFEGTGFTPTIGTFSTAVGVQSLSSASGSENSSFGHSSLKQNTTGYQNTGVGVGSLQLNTTGYLNTAIGYSSLTNMSDGQRNVALGSSAGGSLTSGNQNIFIGDNSGFQTFSGNNNILIGYVSDTATPTTSNSITLGNSSHNVLRCNVTSITSLSDARDKKDVADLRVGLDFVKGLRPVEFVWDDRSEHGKHDIADFGFIAQDLKAAQEDVDMADVLKLVYEANPEKLEASYGKLIPVLVQAIKDLAAKVETLENK